MKPLSETLTELGIAFTFPIEINDAKGYVTYLEDSNNCCEKWEYDANGKLAYWQKWKRDADGNPTYYENSDGYCAITEYGANGKETYYENSRGRKQGTPRSTTNQ